MLNVFTKANVTALSLEIKDALDAIAKKHGVSVEWKNGKYSTTEFKKAFVITTGMAPTPSDTELENLKILHPKLEGKIIQLRGEILHIVGAKARRCKFDIIVQNAKTGKKYVVQSLECYSQLGLYNVVQGMAV